MPLQWERESRVKSFFVFLLWLGCWLQGISEGVAVAKPKYGPEGSPRAVHLAASHQYFQLGDHSAPDFWSLIGYYLPQFNGSACSVASVAMVLNAARSSWIKTADDKFITQTEILNRVKAVDWKKRLSVRGFHGEHGLSLDLLGRAAEAAFQTYGFRGVSVKVVHIPDSSPHTKSEVLQALRENEKSAQDFMIANFNQQAYTDDAAVGHIAPVAAFDESGERVLILDPDREYYEPYWVSVDTFISGMATLDKGAKSNRGFISIRLNASAS